MIWGCSEKHPCLLPGPPEGKSSSWAFWRWFSGCGILCLTSALRTGHGQNDWGPQLFFSAWFCTAERGHFVARTHSLVHCPGQIFEDLLRGAKMSWAPVKWAWTWPGDTRSTAVVVLLLSHSLCGLSVRGQAGHQGTWSSSSSPPEPHRWWGGCRVQNLVLHFTQILPLVVVAHKANHLVSSANLPACWLGTAGVEVSWKWFQIPCDPDGWVI